MLHAYCKMTINSVKINPSLLMMKECDIPHHYQYDRRESMGHTAPIKGHQRDFREILRQEFDLIHPVDSIRLLPIIKI